MTPQARQCERCHRIVEPRGQTQVRFCPACGERLAVVVEPKLGELSRGEAVRAPRTSVQAILGLVLGVLSLAVQPCGFPLGLISLLLGLTAQRSIERAAGLLGGKGLALGAVVLGLISTILWLLINVARTSLHHGYASF